MDEAERTMIRRRWTDEMAESSLTNPSSTLATAAKPLSLERQKLLQELYESTDENGTVPQDFEVANIAREQLQKVVDTFNDAKPSSWQQLGFSHKSGKTKAAEVLRKSLDGSIADLKTSVDSLETEWKEKHGPVYAAFKKICSSLDDHRTILKIFPSQNDYASPLVGCVTILMKAATSHTEIGIMLSKSIAEISDKVGTAASIISVVKTARTRRKLAEIYGRMLLFYQRALEWYLQSKFGRFIRSFNENLVKEFEEAKKELDDSISELYRELAVANTAMVAMVNGKVESLELEILRQRRSYEARDTLAGIRMQKMIQATWTEVKQLESMIEQASRSRLPAEVSSESRIKDVALDCLDKTESLKALETHLSIFIADHEGTSMFDKGRFWLAEKAVLLKLHEWMSENKASRMLWISSPYEMGMAVPGARAAAMATVAAAWQAGTPILSAFCRRSQHNSPRPGISIERTGLISLAYSLIRQLLQFEGTCSGACAVDEKELMALNGDASTWDRCLKLLGGLLEAIPVVTFCVLDGINDFEWGDGAAWCAQLVDVLREQQAKQAQADGAFHILFTTAGQSAVLARRIEAKNRYLTTKRATEVRRSGFEAWLSL